MVSPPKLEPYEDNSSCADGPLTYANTGYNGSGQTDIGTDKIGRYREEGVFNCGQFLKESHPQGEFGLDELVSLCFGFCLSFAWFFPYFPKRWP